MEGGWASSHFHTLVYTHAGGGDTLGNMEKEKVGKIEKKKKKIDRQKTTAKASRCLKNRKRECDKIQ